MCHWRLVRQIAENFCNPRRKPPVALIDGIRRLICRIAHEPGSCIENTGGTDTRDSACQDLAQLLFQSRQSVRFLKKRLAALAQELLRYTFGVVAGGQDSVHRRVDLMHGAECVYPAQPGHVHVQNHDVETLPRPSVVLERNCIIRAIPPGWQFPDICVAQITMEGKQYRSPGFEETPWKLSANLVRQDHVVGAVGVHYTRKKPADVYASNFGPDPIDYRADHGLLEFSEQMGVMIQEVVGTRVGLCAT